MYSMFYPNVVETKNDNSKVYSPGQAPKNRGVVDHVWWNRRGRILLEMPALASTAAC
jgi:hypothetical protein